MEMNTTELQEYLDIHVTTVIDDAKRLAGMHPIEFAGTVTGFLMKTALLIARNNGAHRDVIEEGTQVAIRECYESALPPTSSTTPPNVQ